MSFPPDRPREAQRGPDRPGEAQRGPDSTDGGPERPREARRGPESTDRGPERPREARRGPERPREAQIGRESDILVTGLALQERAPVGCSNLL